MMLRLWWKDVYNKEISFTTSARCGGEPPITLQVVTPKPGEMYPVIWLTEGGAPGHAARDAKGKPVFMFNNGHESWG